MVSQLHLSRWSDREALVVSTVVLGENLGTLTYLALLLQPHCFVISYRPTEGIGVYLVDCSYGLGGMGWLQVLTCA